MELPDRHSTQSGAKAQRDMRMIWVQNAKHSHVSINLDSAAVAHLRFCGCVSAANGERIYYTPGVHARTRAWQLNVSEHALLSAHQRPDGLSDGVSHWCPASSTITFWRDGSLIAVTTIITKMPQPPTMTPNKSARNRDIHTCKSRTCMVFYTQAHSSPNTTDKHTNTHNNLHQEDYLCASHSSAGVEIIQFICAKAGAYDDESNHTTAPRRPRKTNDTFVGTCGFVVAAHCV